MEKEKAGMPRFFAQASRPGLPGEEPREEEQRDPHRRSQGLLAPALLVFHARAVRVVLLPTNFFNGHPFREDPSASAADELHRFLLRSGAFPYTQ